MRVLVMLYFIFLCLILIGCTPDAEIAEKRVEQLSVLVKSEKTQSEKELQADAHCIASGGVFPYSYEWMYGTRTLECAEEVCDISINRIGNHTISCTVTDFQNDSVSDSIVFSVVKEKVSVDSVIALGDSITFGDTLADPSTENWVFLFNSKFTESKLHNLAVSGARAQEVIKDQLLKVPEIDEEEYVISFLWIGANDAYTITSLDQFEEEYSEIVDRLVDSRADEVVLINIPDFSSLGPAKDLSDNVNAITGLFGLQVDVESATRDLIRSYNLVIEKVALEHDLDVIDAFSLMKEFDESLLSEDNFHPNKEGQKEISKIVQEYFREKYPKTEFV